MRCAPGCTPANGTYSPSHRRCEPISGTDHLKGYNATRGFRDYCRTYRTRRATAVPIASALRIHCGRQADRRALGLNGFRLNGIGEDEQLRPATKPIAVFGYVVRGGLCIAAVDVRRSTDEVVIDRRLGPQRALTRL